MVLLWPRSAGAATGYVDRSKITRWWSRQKMHSCDGRSTAGRGPPGKLKCPFRLRVGRVKAETAAFYVGRNGVRRRRWRLRRRRGVRLGCPDACGTATEAVGRSAHAFYRGYTTRRAACVVTFLHVRFLFVFGGTHVTQQQRGGGWLIAGRFCKIILTRTRANRRATICICAVGAAISIK